MTDPNCKWCSGRGVVKSDYDDLRLYGVTEYPCDCGGTIVETKTFYATSTASQPGGKGYYEIIAHTESEARTKVHNFTKGSWSFMYTSLEDVHPLDRVFIKRLV
jgi:hypothetical protein